MSRAKAAFEYFCEAEDCHWVSTKWSGFCPSCGSHDIGERPVAALRGNRSPANGGPLSVPADQLDLAADAAPTPTGIDEFDRVLSGGLTPGSVTLLAGDPGIGKSTLALQAAAEAACWPGGSLYASSEESRGQVGGRLHRLVPAAPPALLVCSETQIEVIIDEANRVRPGLLVVDSVQMLTSAGSDASPGSPNQVKDSVNQLIGFAKGTGTATLLIGHRVKSDPIAGPLQIVHAVDTCATLLGEASHDVRVLRCTKHRFGAVDAVGLFEMTATGMVGVKDPSAVLLAELDMTTPGVGVSAVVEGRRPLMVEVQALTTPSKMMTPRRATTGLDSSRLHLLLAVLERRAGVVVSELEVYAQAAGGFRVADPAGDLGVLLAVASSATGRPIRQGTAVAGEVGLAGQIRSAAMLNQRVTEAASSGFNRLVTRVGPAAPDPVPGFEVVSVTTVAEAIQAALA